MRHRHRVIHITAIHTLTNVQFINLNMRLEYDYKFTSTKVCVSTVSLIQIRINRMIILEIEKKWLF